MKPRAVGVAVVGCLLAVAAAPAYAGLPSPHPRGTGAARYAVEWGAYSGWTYTDLTFKGTFVSSGTLTTGSLTSPGCTSGSGYDPCNAPLYGLVGGQPVSAWCALTPVSYTAAASDLLGPQEQKITLGCSGTRAGSAWGLNLNVVAVTTGDPTVGPPDGPGPPAPFFLSYDGAYTTPD